MIMKKLFNRFVSFLFAIAFLCACGNNTSVPNNRESSTSEKTGESESLDSSAIFRTRPVESTRLPEQRIYLWDVSESLGEKGNNLWTPLQTNLIKAIEAIPVNPLNRIVLIPFYSNPQPPFEEYATEEGKNNIIKAIKEKGSKPVSDVSFGGGQFTNIAAAIKKFHQIAKPGYKNYMFLYTDGKQEDSNGRTCMSILEKELGNWNSNTSSKTKKYGFYYLVHPDADNDYIHSTEEKHDNFWVIDKADVSINIISFPEGYSYNVYAKDTLDVGNHSIGIEGDYINFEGDIKLEANDSLFDFIFRPNMKDGYVDVKVTPKREYIAEGTYPITVSVGYDGEKTPYSFIENTSFEIKCINKREHSAEVSLRMQGRKDNIGKTSYYPSFCFGVSEAKVVSQKAVLNVRYNVYAKNKSTFDISFVDGERNPLKYDEFKIVADGDTLTSENPYVHITGTKAINLEFIPSEVTPDTHFAGYVVFSKPSDIDRINNTETNSGKYAISEWNFKHDNKWNPIKLTIVWLLGILLAALILWLLFLRAIFFPRFNSIQKTFNIPGMAPLIINFKGARMVVLASNLPKKQSLLNRFLTGRIIYKVHQAFNQPIILKPNNRGNGILAKSQNGAYRVQPNPIPGIGNALIIHIAQNLKITVH